TALPIRPPSAARTSPLPYTTLFRSQEANEPLEATTPAVQLLAPPPPATMVGLPELKTPPVERLKPKAWFQGCSGIGLRRELAGSIVGVRFQKVASSAFCAAAVPLKVL